MADKHQISTPTVAGVNVSEGEHIVHLNIRSIRPSKTIDEFKLRFTGTNFNFIAITESWLTENDRSSTYSLGGYTMYRQDRLWIEDPIKNEPKGGGGICTYVNDKYTCSTEALSPLNISESYLEVYSVNIKDANDVTSTICTVYRPPKGDIDLFFEYIEPIISELSSKQKNSMYVLGDFNIDLLDPDKRDDVIRLINLFMQYGLLNWIKKPTREKEKNA